MALKLTDFRPAYRALTTDETARLDRIKSAAASLDIEYATLLELGYGAREIALAKTNLEQSVMWAVKAGTGMRLRTTEAGPPVPPPNTPAQ